MDIRSETYAEGRKSYIEDFDSILSNDMEPWAFIERHGLTPQTDVDPADYPPGTFLVYPEGRPDGVVYIKT